MTRAAKQGQGSSADDNRSSVEDWREDWNRFWFTPSAPETLAVIRIFAGCMLFYTHFVWGLELANFIGPQGRLSYDQFRAFFTTPDYPQGNPFAWSHLPWIEQTGWLMPLHWLSLLAFVALAVGFKTRAAAICSALLTISYSHRLAVAQFGLDQINTLLALYLSVGSSGAAYSWDAWRAARQRARQAGGAGEGSRRARLVHKIDTHIAIRLIQIHMCVIYLFAGCGKLLGVSWWDGTALWGAFANLEYQTVDMTWMVHHEYTVNFLTHLVVAWEVAYCFVIWQPRLRWLMLSLAVPLHLGIGVCMGMITFGLIMLVGNLAFVRPDEVRAAVNWLFRVQRSAPLSSPVPERAAGAISSPTAVESRTQTTAAR